MKRFLRQIEVATLALCLGLTVPGVAQTENAKDEKKSGVTLKCVKAADLADAIAKDSKKASLNFGPKAGRPAVEITGRVTKVVKGEALPTNDDSEVQVHVILGNEKAKMADLISATVKALKYDADKKIVVVESEKLKIAPEKSGGRGQK